MGKKGKADLERQGSLERQRKRRVEKLTLDSPLRANISNYKHSGHLFKVYSRGWAAYQWAKEGGCSLKERKEIANEILKGGLNFI